MSTFPTDAWNYTIMDGVAQVIRIGKAGELVELRAESFCTASGAQPRFQIEGVDASGAPSGAKLRDASWVIMPIPPGADPTHHFDVIRLVTALPVQAGQQIALVARDPTNSCTLSRDLNRGYAGGSLFNGSPDGGWRVTAGAVVFQALVSR